MLDAQNITKSYGMRPVLREVSLHVEPGEFIAVLGPNGAGKSTLLRILATLIRPDSGKLVIDGMDSQQDATRIRSKIGVVSHQSLLYPDLTAVENLNFYAQMYGLDIDSRQSKNKSSTVIDEVLKQVDLLKRAHDPVRTFSRGMAQRLAIARAIIHDPPLLLLDEPYTGLDKAAAQILQRLLLDFAVAGRTVIMTTHELGRGFDGVSRAIILKMGKIVEQLDGAITAERVERIIG